VGEHNKNPLLGVERRGDLPDHEFKGTAPFWVGDCGVNGLPYRSAYKPLGIYQAVYAFELG
jgi:hypothetical protein